MLLCECKFVGLGVVLGVSWGGSWDCFWVVLGRLGGLGGSHFQALAGSWGQDG